ncbi:hypothetical protein FS935_00970 [Metabacillus litoralis]|uniref:ATP-grasp domain-containing protein n=1 Tax=Metabacillus litoralis TaxID=152268 RepID=A0A5C6W5X0_9BACI|nr:YheC/YheD family protein [Metabacillus litoralis]TXC92804.1 hypothetical protein FS935_00970 [Metabacillus litoralis]
MHDHLIGVLLSTQELKKLKKQVNKVDGMPYEYLEKGKELGSQIAFFSIKDVSINEHTVEAYMLQNERMKKETIKIPSVIYNSTKINLKRNIKKLRQLSQMSTVTVINEHHVIKMNHLFELIKSKPELSDYLPKEKKYFGTPFTLHVLAQKNEFLKWNISTIYIKDLDEVIYSLNECGFLFHLEDIEEIEKKIVSVSEKILEVIHFYYPGIHETSLQFSIYDDENMKLQSVRSINTGLDDLLKWKKNLWKTVAMRPIEVASHLKKNTSKSFISSNSDETTITPTIREEKDHLADVERSYWIKFTEFNSDDLVIKLPQELLGNKLKSHLSFEFGIVETMCIVEPAEKTPTFVKGNSYFSPVEVFISSGLAKKTHVKMGLHYQIKLLETKLIIGPTIGFLLGEKNQLYTTQYMEKYSDRFGQYERFGGLVIAFSTRSIDWENKMVYGQIYNPKLQIWEYGSAPIPSAIYRRNFHQNEDRINQLIQLTNNNLFNSHHFKKSDLHLLRDEPTISKHLPSTHIFSNNQDFIRFLHEEKKIILKPVDLSRGRGIFILEENENREGYVLYDYRKKYRIRHLIQDEKILMEMLDNLEICKQQYLYQTYISLLKVNERPFDVRVVMQKNKRMEWDCTGIECRVAGENEELTNIARGGFAMTLEEVIRKSNKPLSYASIHQKVIEVCHNFCLVMTKHAQHYAEFGIDIALDEEGYPWILEANIFPSFKGFKKMDYDTYLKIRYQPLFYAVNLQGFDIVKEDLGNEVYTQNKSYL